MIYNNLLKILPKRSCGEIMKSSYSLIKLYDAAVLQLSSRS